MTAAGVAVREEARAAWPFLPAVALHGSWWVGPLGERVRVNADGTADEVLEVPRRWSSAAEPCSPAARAAGARR